MEIQKTASAGTTEKCDCLVTVSKGSGGRTVQLKSKVLYEYGDRMVTLVHLCLTKMGIQDASWEVEDMAPLTTSLWQDYRPLFTAVRIKRKIFLGGELLYES